MIHFPATPPDFVSILRKNKNKHILLVFYMDGCHVCDEYNEYLNLLSNNYNTLEVIKLDVGVFRELAIDNNIDRVPTSLFIKFDNDDKISWNSKKFIGLDKESIEGLIAKMK
jgi:thiol-disulfide isomerase/thioredoxin